MEEDPVAADLRVQAMVVEEETAVVVVAGEEAAVEAAADKYFPSKNARK